jgi:hypothetical protein
MNPATIRLPRLTDLLRHAGPQLVESTIGPAGLFYAMLCLLGLRAALIATLIWSYLAVVRRVRAKRSLPGMLVIAVAVLSLRTVAALATGSGFVYFIQPTAAPFVLALAFLISVPAGHPLAQRLANDFFPLDPQVVSCPAVRRFFERISLLWTAAFLVNAGLGLWLLLSKSLADFVWLKMVLSVAIIGTATMASTLWFRRVLRGEGIRLCWSLWR